MTGTPGEDGGSRADGTDGGSSGSGRGRSAEGGNVAGGNVEGSAGRKAEGGNVAGRHGRSAEGSPGRNVEGGRGGESGPGRRERWEQWRARAREFWAVARRGAERLWTAARPLLDQLRWQEAEPSPVTLVDRRAAPTLLVPAQGQVYHFVVRMTFTWTSDNARPELFGWYVDQFQPQALQRFRRIAVRCAADIPPDRPRAFMLALEGAMAGDDALPWGYERGEVAFTCEPDVSVYLDEPVRRLLQPYWDQRIALDWQRDLDRRRAEYAEEQRARRRTDTPENSTAPTTGTPENGAAPTADTPENGTAPTAGTPENGATSSTGTPQHGTTPTAGMPESSTAPTAGTPEKGAATTAGMPEALRTDHPPQQRKRQPGGRRVPRPDAPVEQFTPLEPFPPPPATPQARPPGPRPAPPQSGETASGDPDSPGPPDA
ncbi:hypothetical protein ACIBOV_32320 [Micromonospora chersina]|uniref:hypothetical protein n=1 Tax=Micromonospora chersina TaxID=47854 RepID=UPI0037A36B65